MHDSFSATIKMRFLSKRLLSFLDICSTLLYFHKALHHQRKRKMCYLAHLLEILKRIFVFPHRE